jgi:t-SNARE complex subunit (syntaxin)
MTEWAEVERRAAALSMKTGSYIKHISVSGKINMIDMGGVTPLMNAMRSIGNNINQLAKKANEINSIYESDITELKEDYSEICHTLNQFLSTLPSTAA